MHERTKTLRRLIRSNNKTTAEIADMLGRRPITVRIWCGENTERVIPADTLRLLDLLLADEHAQ